MSVYVGIDPSLAGTAIAIIDGDGVRTERLATDPTSTPAETVARMNRIERWLRARLAALPGGDGGRAGIPGGLHIAIEGPAYGRSDGKSHERAGLWWRLYTRAAMHAAQPPTVVVPTQLKKYATGKGSAPKDAVLLAVSRRYPEWEGRTNDEADALVLAAMLARFDGHPIEKWLPQQCLAAMRVLEEADHG